MIMVWKILHKIVGIDRDALFALTESRTRGGTEKLALTRPRYSLRYNYFVKRAGSEFVKLSKKHKTSGNIRHIKTIVNRYLRDTLHAS